MDKLIEALGPAFAAGFAVQQLLEILNPLIEKIFGQANKKIVSGLISLVVGLALSFLAGLRVLKPFGLEAGVVDNIFTGLIISAGTEGFNSIMKFLGYYKQREKADAAMKVKDVEKDHPGAMAKM